ncbi:MAG: CapA family protein [Sideroxydans sp.]|nr:CapA family protein [Sideroxydans sp.]
MNLLQKLFFARAVAASFLVHSVIFFVAHGPALAEETINSSNSEVVVSAVGDMMLDGSSRSVLSEQGYDYPFARVRQYFSGSQIVFGNLEGPLTTRGAPEQDKTYVFRSPPDKVGNALKAAGFNVVTLANNHTLDFGADGLTETVATLDELGIRHVGAGNNLATARQPAQMLVNGLRIAILGYSMTLPENFYAWKNRPGTAFAHEDQVREDIKLAREKADIVLVAFHWGQERSTKLREYQVSIGHAAIDAGADAVIGHHPHILQGIEKYKNGIILYSLGNFTFGTYSANSARSAIAQLYFRNAALYKVRLIPINVNNFEVQFQPQPLSGAAADAVIDNVRTLSAALNTEVINNNGVGEVLLEGK